MTKLTEFQQFVIAALFVIMALVAEIGETVTPHPKSLSMQAMALVSLLGASAMIARLVKQKYMESRGEKA